MAATERPIGESQSYEAFEEMGGGRVAGEIRLAGEALDLLREIRDELRMLRLGHSGQT